MSKKFKAQASSARAASGFGGFGGFQSAASPLSYIAEQPDLSQVAQSNVVVALKNLSKKDSVTKAKALDELLDSLNETTEIAVLVAWSDLYPRIAIDNSQIVRRNAHALQGLLTVNAGKKIAPLLSKVVPSWLAGTFDSDKSVARAASDALDKSFPTQEKKSKLWTVYKEAIQERVDDALLTQTALTLSDERTTSPDDAELKYVRVASTGIRLLEGLVANDLADPTILSESKLWDLAHHDDASLRNAINNLLLTLLTKTKVELDWGVLSMSFVSKGLNRDQLGSTSSYAKVLLKVTDVRPTVWTSDYAGKTAVLKRLTQYLKRGSQSGPAYIWSYMTALVRKIPLEIWKNAVDDARSLGEAYRAGILHERVHVDAAWSSYIDLCSWLCDQLGDAQERDQFLEQNLSPVVHSFVDGANSDSWRIGGRPDRVAIAALQAVGEHSGKVLEESWTRSVDSTIERMKLSLPESSKDYRRSQDEVAAQGKRLLLLSQKSTTTPMSKQNRLSLANSAIELLKARNGKPYGAAVILEALIASGEKLDDNLDQIDFKTLLDSPSAESFVGIALLRHKQIGSLLLSLPAKSSHTFTATERYLSSTQADELDNANVSDAIKSSIGDFEDEQRRAFMVSLLANPNLQKHELRHELLLHLNDNLSSSEKQFHALYMLETISTQPVILKDVAGSEIGSQISSRLLLLSDTADQSLADRASTLSATFHGADNQAGSVLPIIRSQLRGESDMLSILTLTDLGVKLTSSVEPAELLPDDEDWQKALLPLCNSSLPSSLSITSPLRGVAWLIQVDDQQHQVSRDAEEFSLLFRILFFVTKVFSNSYTLVNSTGPRIEALLQYYPIALELINEKLTLDDANNIWLGSTPEVLLAASDVLSEGTSLLSKWLENDTYVQTWLLRGSELESLDRLTYYTALAYQRIISRLFEMRPQEVLQAYEDSLPSIHKSEDLLESSSLLSALNDFLLTSQNGLKMVNELLTHVTQSPADFKEVVLLNILLAGDPTILEKVPQQRQVFALKSLISSLKAISDGKMVCETSRLLSYILPYTKDIYSEAWEELLDELIRCWQTSEVVVINAALQLFAALKKATKAEDTSEDLVSAISSRKAELDACLLSSLTSLSLSSSDVDQPSAITAALLARQLRDVKVTEEANLYALLSSRQVAVREAAFELLHTTIPLKQEQLSIDLALDQKVAQLPEELLHLIEDSTNTEQYLLSWNVLFDHFPKASYRLREAYTSQLKSTNRFEKLLDFICDQLKMTSGRPVDASKFDVAQYQLGSATTSEQGVIELTVHKYFLALTYTPALVKEWFLEQKNRIKQPLESWTQKYMSTLIVASSMATVNDWSSSQSKDADDRPVDVKTSPSGSEIVASIAIDPESPPISLSISLPAAYPLQSPTVSSRARVGVSEKNWQSWLRTIQIIIFSSGSIIEGLLAFRRNVQGALKGQSECAICYSIIGTDMQTPNKKCGTCKNMFHGACLFRWFKSSNSSSCPLCRNNFNYA